MELVVPSKHLEVAVSTALDVSAREHLVVVAKATWSIPAPGARPRPLAPQPMFAEDDFYGAPGESAMRRGDDFARFKPRCDVLFDALAHAPPHAPSRGPLPVRVRVGALDKRVDVYGPRHWRKGLLGPALEHTGALEPTPLHFGLAFGGSRPYRERSGETLTEEHPDNPAGLGWFGAHSHAAIDGAPAPCLEHPDQRLTRPDQALAPCALGAIARHWPARRRYAGTFDAHWRAELAPFLPEDFDERFHQCAPEDQQIDWPRGGEAVELEHVLADAPRITFALPRLDWVTVRILRTDYSTETHVAVCDTLFFETEQRRFSAVWRTSTPIRRRIQEFDTIAVGPVEAEWWRARALGIDPHGCPGCGKGGA